MIETTASRPIAMPTTGAYAAGDPHGRENERQHDVHQEASAGGEYQ